MIVWLPKNQPHGKCNSVDKEREKKKWEELKNNFFEIKICDETVIIGPYVHM